MPKKVAKRSAPPESAVWPDIGDVVDVFDAVYRKWVAGIVFERLFEKKKLVAVSVRGANGQRFVDRRRWRRPGGEETT
jgi:hypothetical protein